MDLVLIGDEMHSSGWVFLRVVLDSGNKTEIKIVLSHQRAWSLCKCQGAPNLTKTSLKV
jgi:hypothetical protein